MKGRMNPQYAFLMASINAAYTCGKNTLVPDDATQKKCEKYSKMSEELKPIAIQYKKNEENLKITNALLVESHEDWIRFQDHSMESVVASWCSMYTQKSKHIREKQINLEEKASEIFYPKRKN